MGSEGLHEYLDALDREDRYQVVEVLKKTPFETTQKVRYTADDGSVEGPFVRKIIAQDSGIGRAYVEIFKSQRSGKRFEHVPSVRECYSRGRDFVVVMEFVAGETLQDVVYRCDPSYELAKDLFPRLCEAAMELHESFDPPIIHRDLKPSNVMLTADTLAIIDFGIARRYDEGAEEDTYHFGTKAYAPPEQFGFGQTDVRSDVYALGMILYYCLTEKTPTNAVRAAGFEDASIPAHLRPVLVKATELDPDERYSSARELRDAFVAACGSVRSDERPFARYAKPSPGASQGGGVPTAGSRFAWARTPVSRALRRMGVESWRDRRSLRFLHGVWTFAVVACFLVWFVACVACAMDPYSNDLSKEHPAWSVSAMFLLFGFGVGVPFAWALLDRREIKRRFPWLPDFLFAGALKKCGLFFLACFAAFFVLTFAT